MYKMSRIGWIITTKFERKYHRSFACAYMIRPLKKPQRLSCFKLFKLAPFVLLKIMFFTEYSPVVVTGA